MSFRAKKIRFWKILPSFLGILVKETCAGLNSFFSALNTTQFLKHSKTFGKKAASTLPAREFFLCFVVKLSNSTVNKDCFSQLKETAQFSSMIWRE